MGHPKQQRKKYETPFRPYDKERLEREKNVLKQYGLKRKKEIWRAAGILRGFRQRARELQASRDELKEKLLLEKLNKLGMRCSKLEDVLGINLDTILSRRLQTLVYKKGFATTPDQARQMIVHGHIHIMSRKIRWPGYLVPTELEGTMQMNPVMSSRIIAKEQAAAALPAAAETESGEKPDE